MTTAQLTTAELEEQAKNAKAEIDRRTAAAKQRNEQRESLQKQVAACETALVELESKKQFLKQRKSQIQSQLLDLWSRQPADLLNPGVSPIQLVVELNGTSLAIDAALADAPRAKKHLDAQLQTAKQQLDAFSKR